MDTITKFINDNIFSESNKFNISRYGNDTVDLINKFIRIVIAFGIVYLVIIKMPDHGDKDHTMYFNLLLLISIFLILIYIQKYWRDYYISDFLGASGFGPECAGDLEFIPKEDPGGKVCPRGIEKNVKAAGVSVLHAVTKEFSVWYHYFICLGIGLGLRQLGLPIYYAAIVFFPFDCLKGLIWFILFASKYSPINFLFGKSGGVEDPYIYGNKISKDNKSKNETELTNFNERFYLMYIVLILLIFFTIIIRLTSDTIIDCKNFVGPIPVPGGLLKGCIGYRFYMSLNVILFIGFSADFVDSLQKISLDDGLLECPWKEAGPREDRVPGSEQIYKSNSTVCLEPENIIDTPICNPNTEIIECEPANPSPLPGCLIERTEKDYILKEIAEFNNTDPNGNGTQQKILIKKNPDGDGYVIDERGPAIKIESPECQNSIESWLASKNDRDDLFAKITGPVIESLNLTSNAKTKLSRVLSPPK